MLQPKPVTTLALESLFTQEELLFLRNNTKQGLLDCCKLTELAQRIKLASFLLYGRELAPNTNNVDKAETLYGTIYALAADKMVFIPHSRQVVHQEEFCGALVPITTGGFSLINFIEAEPIRTSRSFHINTTDPYNDLILQQHSWGGIIKITPRLFPDEPERAVMTFDRYHELQKFLQYS
jgi:hypothetical protein